MSNTTGFGLEHGSIIPGITFDGSFPDAVSDLLSHNEILLVGSSFVVNLTHVTEVTKTTGFRL